MFCQNERDADDECSTDESEDEEEEDLHLKILLIDVQCVVKICNKYGNTRIMKCSQNRSLSNQ